MFNTDFDYLINEYSVAKRLLVIKTYDKIKKPIYLREVLEMKRTIYTYKEYPDYPDATATSRTCNFINWFICLIGFIATILALIDGDIILGLIIIGGVVLISVLIKKIENLLIYSIIKATPHRK